MAEKFTQKWCLIAFLEPVEDGYEFNRGEWPLHITLAGVFAMDWDDKKRHQLAEVLASSGNFSITAGAEDKWSYRKDSHMVMVQQGSQLEALHHELHQFLVNNGAVFNEPQYEADGYIPHCTFQAHARLNEGDVRKIDSLSLIDMFPGKDGLRRKVANTWELG